MPAAAMGRLLAGGAVVAGVAVGPLLGRPPGSEPQGNAMGSGPAKPWQEVRAGGPQPPEAAPDPGDAKDAICCAPT